MKKLASAALLAIGMATGVGLHAAPYSITGTATYESGCGRAANAEVGACGSPDTGFLMISNTGPTAFTGTARLFGIAPSQTIDISIVGTLNPGDVWKFAAGPESSNMGGFNKSGGVDPDNGLQFSMNGLFGADAFSDSIFDKDIHSGVVNTNPFGVSLDNYILQGGDPLGRDTGDTFEEGQAAGVFVWTNNRGNIPEPPVVLLLALGLASIGWVAGRKR